MSRAWRQVEELRAQLQENAGPRAAASGAAAAAAGVAQASGSAHAASEVCGTKKRNGSRLQE
eukprot:507222-Pelagomonas_calceolata.AAC.4